MRAWVAMGVGAAGFVLSLLTSGCATGQAVVKDEAICVAPVAAAISCVWNQAMQAAKDLQSSQQATPAPKVP